MSQVVQARCPHCQNVLRIPEEWLTRAMRCKHCKKTFQAQAKVSTNVPVGLPASTATKAGAPVAKPVQPIPVAKPANAVAPGAPLAGPPRSPGDQPFGFDEDDAPSIEVAPARRRSKGRGMLVLVLMFLFLFVLGAGGVGFVAYKAMNLAPPNPGPVAKGDGGSKSDGTSVPVKPSIDRDGKPKEKNTEPVVPTDGLKYKDPNKKKTPPAKKDSVVKDGLPKKTFGSEPFPRRALLISVNNYLMWNTVHYGSAPDPGRIPPYPGSSTAVLRDRLSRPPMNFPVSQVFELSDAIPAEYKGAKAHSTQKSVLETTIGEFLDTCRAQDRIILFYAGHAAHIENVSYLVPIDGKKTDLNSLLPLKWVFDQLAKCKAQQKILILDVFRFSPSRGFELPSPGEGEEGAMPEGFEKDLLSPPSGVQVWSSCIKGQSAVELDEGSAFTQALCNSLQGGGKMAGISTQTQPIQIESLVADVNNRLKDLLVGEKRTQVSRLTGKAGDREVAFDPAEPLATAITFKPPTAPGGEAAPVSTVEKILEELRVMPPVRDTRAGDISLLRAQNLPAFSVKKLDGYKADGYQNIADLQKKFKANREDFAKEFPLRAAYFETLEALEESRGVKMREVLSKAEADPKRKAAFLLEQAPLGISIFKLQGALSALEEAKEKRDTETSKRWQANFDYVNARLLSRLTYLYEYNFTLGQIRNDNLPELMGGQSGWRVGISGAKITVTEPKAKKYQKDIEKLWKRIQEDYPETPWALLAQRESMFSLGLAWRPKSD